MQHFLTSIIIDRAESKQNAARVICSPLTHVLVCSLALFIPLSFSLSLCPANFSKQSNERGKENHARRAKQIAQNLGACDVFSTPSFSSTTTFFPFALKLNTEQTNELTPPAPCRGVCQMILRAIFQFLRSFSITLFHYTSCYHHANAVVTRSDLYAHKAS